MNWKMILLIVKVLIFFITNTVFTQKYHAQNSTKLFVVIAIQAENNGAENNDLYEINKALVNTLHKSNRNNFKKENEVHNLLKKNNKTLNSVIKDSKSLKKLGEDLKVRFIIISFITKINERYALSVNINDVVDGKNKIIAADKNKCSVDNFKRTIIPKISKEILRYCNSNK